MTAGISDHYKSPSPRRLALVHLPDLYFFLYENTKLRTHHKTTCKISLNRSLAKTMKSAREGEGTPSGHNDEVRARCLIQPILIDWWFTKKLELDASYCPINRTRYFLVSYSCIFFSFSCEFSPCSISLGLIFVSFSL